MTRDEAMQLMLECDDPEHLLFPETASPDLLHDVQRFHSALEEVAGESLSLLDNSAGALQDAPYLAQIWLNPGGLRFSNFGRMIALLPEDDIQPTEERLSAVARLAGEFGFVLIPRTVAEEPYSGVVANPNINRWWDRFFDFF